MAELVEKLSVKLSSPGTKADVQTKKGGRKVVKKRTTYRGDVGRFIDWEKIKIDPTMVI